MISQRFFRAFSASRNRAFEALGDKKKFRSDIFSPYVSAEISGVSQTVERRGTFHNATLDLDRIELMCFVVVNDAGNDEQESRHHQPSSDFRIRVRQNTPQWRS